VDCNQLAVDIDNEIAVVHNFMRDKYRLKFPELESLVHHPIDYARVVKAIGNEMDITLIDLDDILPQVRVVWFWWDLGFDGIPCTALLGFQAWMCWDLRDLPWLTWTTFCRMCGWFWWDLGFDEIPCMDLLEFEGSSLIDLDGLLPQVRG
jgi:hypothetical protein